MEFMEEVKNYRIALSSNKSQWRAYSEDGDEIIADKFIIQTPCWTETGMERKIEEEKSKKKISYKGPAYVIYTRAKVKKLAGTKSSYIFYL